MRKISLALLAAGSAAAVDAYAATELRIGTTAAAKSQVTGTLGASTRALRIGDGVFQDENIATGMGANAQILFADETVLTLGPNTVVTLDKFAYDPSKRKGQMSIRAVTGAFRFVSGSGPKEGYKINTAFGTIGIRGTIIEVRILSQGVMLSLTEGGTYFCTRAQKCTELTTPGSYLISNGQHSGDAKSKYDKACGSGAGPAQCKLGDDGDTLYIDFLGQRTFNDIAPGSGPQGSPNNPPTSPPPGGGYPPITTGAGTIPPGLENRSTLPPGLANNRGPNFEPPGRLKNGK